MNTLMQKCPKASIRKTKSLFPQGLVRNLSKFLESFAGPRRRKISSRRLRLRGIRQPQEPRQPQPQHHRSQPRLSLWPFRELNLQPLSSRPQICQSPPVSKLHLGLRTLRLLRLGSRQLPWYLPRRFWRKRKKPIEFGAKSWRPFEATISFLIWRLKSRATCPERANESNPSSPTPSTNASWSGGSSSTSSRSCWCRRSGKFETLKSSDGFYENFPVVLWGFFAWNKFFWCSKWNLSKLLA